MKVLVVDISYDFTSDIESRLILDEIEEVDIITRNEVNRIHLEVERIKPDAIVIASNLILSHPTWDFDIPVRTYCRKAEELALSTEKGFSSYGVIKSAGELINAIIENKLVTVVPKKEEPKPEPTPAQEVKPEPVPEVSNPHFEPKTEVSHVDPPNPELTTPAQETPVPKTEASQNNNAGSAPMDFAELLKNDPQAQAFLNWLAAQNVLPQGGNMQPQPARQEEPKPEPQPKIVPKTPSPEPVIPDDDDLFGESEPSAPSTDTENTQYKGYGSEEEEANKILSNYSSDVRTRLRESQQKEAEAKKQAEAAARKEIYNEAEATVNRDLGVTKPEAKVISIYSAKGGVGKTTIACELATLLALTSHGRGRFRVCVIDLDVAYGDVLAKLDFDPTHSTLTTWCRDIDKRLNAGAFPEEIQYTREEIETFLQKKEETGLYALLAPITHDEYMNIPADRFCSMISIIIDNLKTNGEFDFVICDTGNNIDDAAFIGLNNAKEILLVLNQSINTANCNNMFLRTMNKMGLDMSKVKTIINEARPTKAVGVSIDEVKEYFVNPITKKPFECYAIIKDYDEVRYSGNTGKPIVYQSRHGFTQTIGEISKKIIGDTFVLSAPEKKKGFFGRKRK